MTTTRENRQGFRRAVLCAVAVVSAMASAHAETADKSTAAVTANLDPVVQKLKQETLSIGIAAQRADEDRRYPLATRTCIDISDGVTSLLLHEITVTIDDGQPTHYVYDNSASLALIRGGLHRLLELNVAAGTHRLHADFSASYVASQPWDPAITGSFDQYFDKVDGQPLTVELALGKANDASPPALSLRTWSAAQ
jgi:hypothetical protein